jgi:hypothetical protein
MQFGEISPTYRPKANPRPTGFADRTARRDHAVQESLRRGIFGRGADELLQPKRHRNSTICGNTEKVLDHHGSKSVTVTLVRGKRIERPL